MYEKLAPDLIFRRYRDLIEEGRQRFQKELAALLPHVNLGQEPIL
jgi:hypothetical protein